MTASAALLGAGRGSGRRPAGSADGATGATSSAMEHRRPRTWGTRSDSRLNGPNGISGGDRDTSLMLSLEKELDVLADELGVARSSSFYDHSGLAEDYADLLEDEGLDPSQISAEEVWFAAARGRDSISALLRVLRESPERLRLEPDRSRTGRGS